MRKDQKKKWAYVSRISLLILTLFFTLHLSAQNKKTITGTILDEKGESIIGASVAVKGTTNGTITDIDGKFSLNVNENDILAISYVGFLAQEIPVTGKSNLQITLKENTEMLDEIVVVGYGVMRKRDLTGAVSSIDSKSMQDKPVANIGEALQGRASGVQIINSGAPGSNVSIRIRGISTINNSEPLLVIDGVPTDLSLNALNMDDVQTVDVLKDASATAIYGSRGANGVVIITTKKGKSGDGVVSFSANWGIQDATSMPDMLNASQFASYHNDMIANYSGTENLMQRPDFADPTTLGKGTDWIDELFRTSMIQNYSVSYSGGTDKSNYYVSAGILDQEGIVTDTSYKRYTVQFNGESKVKPWLKLGNNVTLSHDAKKQGSYSIRDAMAAQPTQPVYNEDGTYSGPGNPAYWYGDIKNPLGNAKVNSQSTKGYNLLGNIFAEINFFDKVTFKTLGGIDFKFWDKENFSPKYDWKPISQPESYRYEESNKSLTYLWDNTLTYIDTFNENHHLNVMIGSSAQNNVYNKMNASVQGFLSDKNNQLSNGLNQPTVGGTKNDWALLSFMGRVNYNYTDKYLLTLTVRRDGSSRFSKDNRWGTFPSVAAAWRLSEEAFYQKNKWVNDIKVRAGYGVTGNQWGINEYAYFTKLKTGQYVFNGTPVSTLYPLVMPNPDVKWETVKQWNAGIDLSLIDQRINLSLDGYIKNTTDMLVPMAVPITTGYSDIYVPSINAGKVRNTGWELTISSRNLTGELEWNTDLNVSYNKNKVISMNDGVPLFTGDDINMTKVLVNAEGNPINSFYGYVTNGLFQNWDQVNNASIQVPGGTAPGDIRFSDLDNNGVINDNDRTYIGNPTPEWSFSMNNSFAYKNFDLQIFLQGVAGNDIYNANRIWQEGMAVPQNQTAKVLDRWTGEGTSNSVPRAVYSDPNKNARHSDRFVEDGSYLRIKNLTLGYTLPQAISKKAYLQTVRMYMSCQNLYTFTKYSGFDPEVGANGIDLSTYPLTRTISFGVNVKF
ncbi:MULTISPECIES: TonB-dependent receptor [unclassified Dysgonomonas]|jgi:TonB-linked SusC/RagA family outer membrane protein|uniref:SusC/RagA family TonB-linked outer membrane protein n=1 Tax=unclassified Dysgonomonas TaxID=2630389 RepID=UPI0025C556B6|nr:MULTISPECIES: TonB-dependent receptor [unclassified Dysgonomonas]MDR2003112.1 TonB-dependent receptor [Prevotella sp.]HMM04063.1 TonB-dependent receptor [Dysgonomonas sp.]